MNGYSLKVNYGDISHEPYFTSRMELIPEADSYCARNSKGKIVPVVEEGWDAADATPTHIMVMFSAGATEPTQELQAPLSGSTISPSLIDT